MAEPRPDQQEKTEPATPKRLETYAGICGWTLARAHARSVDPSLVSGYLGSGERFIESVADEMASFFRG